MRRGETGIHHHNDDDDDYEDDDIYILMQCLSVCHEK